MKRRDFWRNRSGAGDWLIFPPIRGLGSDHSLSVAVHSTGKNVPVPLAVRERLRFRLEAKGLSVTTASPGDDS